MWDALHVQPVSDALSQAARPSRSTWQMLWISLSPEKCSSSKRPCSQVVETWLISSFLTLSCLEALKMVLKPFLTVFGAFSEEVCKGDCSMIMHNIEKHRCPPKSFQNQNLQVLIYGNEIRDDGPPPPPHGLGGGRSTFLLLCPSVLIQRVPPLIWPKNVTNEAFLDFFSKGPHKELSSLQMLFWELSKGFPPWFGQKMSQINLF